jgi:hypothetical protein
MEYSLTIIIVNLRLRAGRPRGRVLSTRMFASSCRPDHLMGPSSFFMLSRPVVGPIQFLHVVQTTCWPIQFLHVVQTSCGAHPVSSCCPDQLWGPSSFSMSPRQVVGPIQFLHVAQTSCGAQPVSPCRPDKLWCPTSYLYNGHHEPFPRTWSWPLTTKWYRGQEHVDPYINHPPYVFVV